MSTRVLTFPENHVVVDVVCWIIQEFVKFSFHHTSESWIDGIASDILENNATKRNNKKSGNRKQLWKDIMIIKYQR